MISSSELPFGPAVPQTQPLHRRHLRPLETQRFWREILVLISGTQQAFSKEISAFALDFWLHALTKGSIIVCKILSLKGLLEACGLRGRERGRGMPCV